jgi:hypothetical protein
VAAELHLAEDALALHLLLQHPEGLTLLSRTFLLRVNEMIE